MCNLSQGILEQGIEQGKKQGVEQGKELGRDTTLDIIDRREEFPDEPYEETAKEVGCSLDDVLAIVNRRKRSWKK